MPSTFYEIRLFSECGLRYPRASESPFDDRCPRCLGATVQVLTRPLSMEKQSASKAERGKEPSPLRVEAILDNIRSDWNVGAIFRTADAIGVKKLYLCGITPTPDNPRLNKTALGAEAWVPWEYSLNSVIVARTLKTSGAFLLALEQDERAVDLSSCLSLIDIGKHGPSNQTRTLILIVGNEITGVDPGLLELADTVLDIRMLGKKRSLNVAVAFGIAVYQLPLLFDN